MIDPQISCPNCGHEIKLTESLAAPLLKETRARFQEQLAAKDAEVARKEQFLRKQQADLENARRSVDEHIAERLRTERAQIVEAEARKARQATADELAAKDGELAETKLALSQNNAKLAEAQRMQAELLRKERVLDDAKREMDLTVEKRVQGELTAVHTKARQDAEQALSLKLADKDKQLSDMSRTIEELRRKVEQGSQQAQGETDVLKDPHAHLPGSGVVA